LCCVSHAGHEFEEAGESSPSIETLFLMKYTLKLIPLSTSWSHTPCIMKDNVCQDCALPRRIRYDAAAIKRRLSRQLETKFHESRFSLPIALLPIPSRLMRSLARAGVETLRDLEGISESQLLRWKNIGPGSVEQIREMMNFE